MSRWTKRILIGCGVVLVIAAIAGASYQWVATAGASRELQRPGGSWISVATGFTFGAAVQGRPQSFSRTGWGVRARTGVSYSRRLPDSRRSARTTEREWATAIRDRHRGRPAESHLSSFNCSTALALLGGGPCGSLDRGSRRPGFRVGASSAHCGSRARRCFP